MDIRLSAESWQVLIAFGAYLVGVAALGIFSHRYLTRGSFVKEYFLGNRSLGPWVLALTVAATAISGGTFMGFPSLIYTNGWIMALWIASYMVVPLTTMVLMGKRLNQVARLSGSVTVPDVLRDRFQSPVLGICATLVILICLTFNLVAQFKAGGLVMAEALRLPPVEARFLGAEVDAERNLVLRFELPDGSHEVQKTPLPGDGAVYVADGTKVLSLEGRPTHVNVLFQAKDKVFTKSIRFPPQKIKIPGLELPLDKGYFLGLLIFAFTVVAYTTYGGFWAITWTDVLEGLVMLIGVVVMAVLAVRAVAPINGHTALAAATEHLRQMDPNLVQGPGPKAFLPLGMAFSFFLMWSLSGAGQPSGMVRLMSFRDSASLRRALLLVCGYYLLTYLSLLVIFICARAIYPTEYLGEAGSEGQPDSITPVMARTLAPPVVAGLLLAAPYAAIMSTVAAYLLMISSSLVRDLYQRTINPDVSTRTIKRLSYVMTALIGLVVVFGALRPPRFLQYIIVFTGAGMSCSFLFPMLMMLYWRRATSRGMLAGMLGGFVTVMGLYVLGWIDSNTQATLRDYDQRLAQATANNDPPPARPETARGVRQALQWLPGWGEKKLDAFAPLYAGGVDPLIWGLSVSFILSIAGSLAGQPDPKLVEKYFP